MPEKYKQRIMDHVARRTYEPKKVRALARHLGIADREYGEFREAIKALRAAGRIVVGAGDAVLLPEVGRHVVGKFRANPRGFGFIIPDTPNSHGDLFVPEGDALDAVTGDTVRARVSKRGKRDGKMLYRARVLEVLERGRNRFVGELLKDAARWYVRPDGNALHVPIFVADAKAARARQGDQVVVEIITYPSATTRAQGVITEVLGPRGRPGVDVLSIIRQYQLPDAFDERVLDAARQAVANFDLDAAKQGRKDLRNVTIVTIDPPDARDFDDAISLRVTEDGLYELGVHIADVAYFLTEGSPVDEEARLRGNSVYFPGHVLPMIPELLSNGLCSLQEDQPRLAKSVFIRYDAKGKVRGSQVANTIIRSAKRLTYEQASLIMDGKTGGFRRPVVELVRRMQELARIIQRRRLADGMLVLDVPEVELVLDDDGKVIDAVPADDSFSHTVIEMFMVEANEAVARLLHGLGVPALRRIHPDPDPSSLTQLSKYLRLLGRDAPQSMDRFDLQRMLQQVRGSPQSFAVNLAVLRSLQRAEYSPGTTGHFALGSEHYLHFTSPIRRYPDLTAHRLIDRHLCGEIKKRRKHDRADGREGLADLGRHCSYTERRAEDAERELKEVKVLELLSQRVGEEVRGVVTGVTRFGVFVQIETFLIEGLIPLEDLPDDWWQLDQKAGCLVGEMTGKRISIGDVAAAQLAGVDVAARRLDLAYVSHTSASRPTARKTGRGKKADSRTRKVRPAKTGKIGKTGKTKKTGKGARHSKRRARRSG